MSERATRANVLVDPGSIESNVSPDGSERADLFRIGDSWSRSNHFAFAGGLRMDVSTSRFEPAFSFAVEQPPAELEFVVSKGAAVSVECGELRYERLGNTFEVGAFKVAPTGSEVGQAVTLSLRPALLLQLLGVTEPPPSLRQVLGHDGPAPAVSRAMTPALFRGLEEIANADIKGVSRRLWHQAKSLELLGLMTDELEDGARGLPARLTATDVERLERLRRSLFERLEHTPTHAELASAVGFSETRLRVAFKARFGASLFAYLRQLRMQEARRLIVDEHLNVTEAALRVGYSNPSKFAAAFRREFDTSPSSVGPRPGAEEEP
ncbi:MAG: helix-turn-helix transcriptional regulator [Archangium sp.]|nr:helix-turn-helix transcriptional regulator [Archangium sp.]